jgi:hypothetical protein
MRLTRWSLAAVLAGGLAMVPACAAQSEYEMGDALVAGVNAPAARYPVPPGSPQGQVTITSRGVVSIAPRGGGEPEPMLGVELSVTNERDLGPWRLDAQAQRLSFGGREEIPPALVSASVPGAPRLVVPPGGSAVVDLYFPVPPGFGPADIANYQLSWRLETPGRVVAALTPFQVPVEDLGSSYAVAPPPYYYNRGAAWWYDPFYYPAFAFPPVISFGYSHFHDHHFHGGRGYGGYGYGGHGHGYGYGRNGYGHGPDRYGREPSARGGPAPAVPEGPIDRPPPAVPSTPNMSAPTAPAMPPSSGPPAMSAPPPVMSAPPSPPPMMSAPAMPAAPPAPPPAPPPVPSTPNISAPHR